MECKNQNKKVQATCSNAVDGLKKITLFYMNGCPYCRNANIAIEELIQENPAYGDIEIERIDEQNPPAGLSGYNYYYVPSMFIGKDKIYEAQPGQQYDEIKEHVKEVFEKAK